MKQQSAPEARNLIDEEFGTCASFNSEEGHCVGVYNFLFALLMHTFLISSLNSFCVSVHSSKTINIVL